MAFSHTSILPIRDLSNQSRSSSTYDTAKSHLDTCPQDHTANEATIRGYIRDRSRTSCSPSISDHRFFQAPDAGVSNFLSYDTAQGLEESSSFDIPPPSDSLANYSRYWRHPLRKENRSHTISTTECSPNYEFVCSQSRRTRTLETIAERGSHSTVTSKRSLSELPFAIYPLAESQTSYLNGRSAYSAPCILVTTTKINEDSTTPIYIDQENKSKVQDLRDTLGGSPATGFSALQYWTTLCSSAFRSKERSDDRVQGSSGTWPMPTSSKRTPAASIRDIFEKLLASGFTSDPPSAQSRVETPSEVSKLCQNEDYDGRKSQTIDQINNSDFQISEREAEIESLLEPWAEGSLAIAALKRVLLENDGDFGSHTTGYEVERKDNAREASWRGFVPTSCRSLARTKSTLSSVKDIAESLRRITISSGSSTEDDIGVTLGRAEKTFAEFSASSCYSSADESLEKYHKSPEQCRDRCGEIPSQSSKSQLDGPAISASFNDCSTSQRSESDRSTSPPSPNNSLTPSPLRPCQSKQLTKLSLFPVEERSVNTVPINNSSRWRSISSLLRFSHRDPHSKELVHHYNCSHGHRIISTSTYGGAKIKSSRLHTELFRTNTPDSCWRCSARDVCDKIWYKVSFPTVRRKQQRKRSAPLFIDPSASANAHSDVGTITTVKNRRPSRSSINHVRAKPGKRHLTGQSSRSRFLSKFMSRPIPLRESARRLATKFKGFKSDRQRKGGSRKRTSKDVVPSGDTDGSRESLSDQIASLRTSSVRKLID